MKGLTLTQREQTRLQVLSRLVAKQLTTGEATTILGVSERHTWRMLAVDDATGTAPNGVFREQEDTHGYFMLLEGIIARRGIPLGVGGRYPRDPLHMPSIHDGIDEPVPGIPVFGPKAHISNAYGHHRVIQDDANSYPYSVNVGDPYPILRRYVDNNSIPPYSEFSILEMARTIGALTMVGRTPGANQFEDTTPPTTETITPADWVNTDVTVDLVATDNESGVASLYYCTDQANTCEPTLSTSCAGLTCEAEVTIAQEGIHFTRYYAIDNAGNVEVVRSREVRIDKTPPTITSSRDIAPNANNWTNTDVTVSYVASDALSGIDPVASDFGDDVLSSEGTDQSTSGAAVDLAGNSATATEAGINIDKTAPTVTINTPTDGSTFDFGDLVLADYTVHDSLSGSDGIAGTVPNGSPIDTARVGTLAFMVSATDLAGADLVNVNTALIL